MPIEIIVPRLGWSMEEGAFVAWLKKDGEFVEAGDPLFSIEGDKAVQEIESIDSGILRIAPNGPKPGQPIHVGDLLGHLISSGEAVAIPAKIEKVAAKPPLSEKQPVALPPEIRPPVQRLKNAPAIKRPTISPRALRLAEELGVDWTVVRGTGRTGRIRERDIRASGAVYSDLPSGTKATVLVTGACGFIGTWVLRELLERNLEVVAFDLGERPERWERVIGARGKEIPLIQGSLLDQALLKRVFEEHQITHVIHLAALLTPACQADPMEGCRVNVLGSLALFEQIRTFVNRIQGFSYGSSVAVFGAEPEQVEGGLERESDPLTFYGVFKKSVEMIAAQYWRHFKIASVGFRPQVAYGPEREVGLTAGPSLAARAAARGEPFCISYTGQVGYDYVEDVARAFVRGALETPPGAKVIDLAGEIADVNQVLAAIAKEAPEAAARLSVNGAPIPEHTPRNPRFISTIYPDWKTTSLAEGIKRTIEFYRART